MSEKPKNALSNVVSDLIRAAAGSSARNVSDADVDKYVADLILKEAQEKRKKYDVLGVKAYQPNGLPDKPKPKPNTRFLLNMVKATDSHNQAVIKANEDNVAKLREERLERERCTRLKEIEEKHARERRRHRLTNDRHYTSSSSDHKKRRRSIDDEKEDKDREHRKHKKKSSSDTSSSHTSKSSSRHHHHHHHDKKDTKQPQQSQEPIQYKGRGKVRINVSSMDKYFAKGYDPLLDVDSDKEEEYVFAKEEDSSKKKKHKKKSKKSKKKSHKHREKTPSSSSSSSSSEEEESAPKPVRAWDIGKV